MRTELLGYTKFGIAKNTQYGSATAYEGAGISGRNAVVDFFYKFWTSLDRPMRKDVRPSELRRHLDHVVLMDVHHHDDGFGLHVRLIGTYVASYYGEISGQDINSMPNKHAAQRIYNICERLLKEDQPLLTVTPGFDEGKQYLEAYALYMPLYDADGSIEKIMVGVDVASLNPPANG